MKPTVPPRQQLLAAQFPHIKQPQEHAFDRLRDHMTEFEAQLPAKQEVGIMVAGGGSVLHVATITRSGQLFVFSGQDENGRTASLVQHYTQVNVLTVAVDKLLDKPHRIGFHSDSESSVPDASN